MAVSVFPALGERPTESQSGKQRDRPVIVSGTISSIDLANNTVTIKGADSKEITYTVDAAAKISISGKDGSLGDLKKGDSVTAEVRGKKLVSIHL
jgi:hypothetical protein